MPPKSGAGKATFVEPMAARVVRDLPQGPEWMYELKFDGYRALLIKNGEWNDPTVLESLAPSSVKVTLREGETTRQNYRMGGA